MFILQTHLRTQFKIHKKFYLHINYIYKTLPKFKSGLRSEELAVSVYYRMELKDNTNKTQRI